MSDSPDPNHRTKASGEPAAFSGGGTFLSPDLDPEPDPELVAQGWERRFTAGPMRAKEATELYKAMGYEVHVEPVRPDEFNEECAGCLLTTHFFVTLYTRKPVNKLKN